MNVEISGAVLSSLFFEHSVCNNDLEGFLLGRITSRSSDTISDAQISGIKEELTSYIYSYVSCPKPFTWYNNSGATDPDKLKTVLSVEQIREVVGWYKFKRNATLMTSLRERAIHRNLLRSLPGVMAPHFVFLLCTLQQSLNKSTHTMDHVFQVYNGSDHFLGQHGQIQSVLTMHNMSRALNEQLEDLCISVWASEDELWELRHDVIQLKTKLRPQKTKSESGRRDLNPFKTVSVSEVSIPQTSRVFSSKNPFYFGYQAAVVMPLLVNDPPPPYSEKDHFFTDHPNSSAAGSTSADAMAPDIDLIALGDFKEDLRTVTKFGIYNDFSDNSIDTLLDQPTTLLDTSIPEIDSEPVASWNIGGSAAEAGAFGLFDDGADYATLGRSSDFSKLIQDERFASLGRLKALNVSQPRNTSGEHRETRGRVLEAIEQSTDEDQRET